VLIEFKQTGSDCACNVRKKEVPAEGSGEPVPVACSLQPDVPRSLQRASRPSALACRTGITR